VVDLPPTPTVDWSYVHDVRVPGMVLMAAWWRPPLRRVLMRVRFPHQPIAVDEASVQHVQGLVARCQDLRFRRVVAERE